MEQLIKVPDIGSTNAVDVIEILVKVGDTIDVDTPLITLESDKASMEIPSSQAGVVKSIQVKVGDKVQMGDVILTLEGMAEKPAAKEEAAPAPMPTPAPTAAPAPQVASASREETINVPDIGSTNDVDVIEILVKVGDSIQVDTPLITLESDKASMEIPSDREGTVQSILVKIGDKVNKGSAILTISTTSTSSAAVGVETPKIEKVPQEEPRQSMPVPVEHVPSSDAGILAGPAVRRLARVLGVDLKQVSGTGKKARIQIEDVEQYVKARLQQSVSTQTSSGFSLPSAPEIDFSQFGEIEKQDLSKIKKLSGQNLHRSWLQIPHVTQFDEADITDLESFRKQQSSLLEAEGIKLTILAFITKAVSRALIQFPEFNSSLSADGQTLILKKFINIGIAVDTPQGLVVPVIKNVEKLSIKEIAQAMAELSQKARKKALLPSDMSGGTFTISSLGGIGGTAFTPIVNHPEVAILGVSKSSMKPVFQNNNFVPRLMLPLSLSYDHRVIDGAQGARFTRYLSELLSDIRKIML
jgi:pyruvate dehydrogenase E2 component (dihydrolipoamide acetyltransferase)